MPMSRTIVDQIRVVPGTAANLAKPDIDPQPEPPDPSLKGMTVV
jgi:hypothetical protein